MPAPRKPEGQRVRRNLPTSKLQLPLDGYDGPIPDWPFGELDTELHAIWWEKLWRTPQAKSWVRMHIEDVIARYVDVAVALRYEHKATVASAQMHAELRQLEDRLGRNPRAMRSLDWEIADDEMPEAPVAQIARRRLKAVDPDGAA